MIVAAVVTAAGEVLSTLLQGFKRREAPTTQANEVIAKTYEQLQSEVTTNSLLILLVLKERGSKLSEGMIRFEVEPWAKAQIRGGEPFENDLTYRMKFLRTLGLVRITQDEWALTHLGAAFIEKAYSDNLNYRDAFGRGAHTRHSGA